MDLRQVFQKSKRGLSNHSMYHPEDFKIVPEVRKIMVMSCATIVYIIDIGICEVVQALNPSDVDQLVINGWFPYFENRKELIVKIDSRFRNYVFSFSLNSSLSLKQQARDFIVHNFSIDQVVKCNLPRSLLKEILNKKIY